MSHSKYELTVEQDNPGKDERGPHGKNDAGVVAKSKQGFFKEPDYWTPKVAVATMFMFPVMSFVLLFGAPADEDGGWSPALIENPLLCLFVGAAWLLTPLIGLAGFLLASVVTLIHDAGVALAECAGLYEENTATAKP